MHMKSYVKMFEKCLNYYQKLRDVCLKHIKNKEEEGNNLNILMYALKVQQLKLLHFHMFAIVFPFYIFNC